MFNNCQIRFAKIQDINTIFSLIQALAVYENLSDSVTGNAQQLAQDVFGDDPCIEIIVAQVDQLVVGFALFFTNYSTFLTRRGIYLEDLFIQAEYRRQGIGKQLLIYLAKLAVSRQAGRLEWSVLDWNESAIAFYQKMGASILSDWRICRVTGDNLVTLAQKDI
jgi:GNAT superfamily N-acetyltransferase